MILSDETLNEVLHCYVSYGIMRNYISGITDPDTDLDDEREEIAKDQRKMLDEMTPNELDAYISEIDKKYAPENANDSERTLDELDEAYTRAWASIRYYLVASGESDEKDIAKAEDDAVEDELKWIDEQGGPGMVLKNFFYVNLPEE